MKIIVTGAAGPVGKTLIPRLKASGAHHIAGLNKHPANLRILRALHPDIEIIDADLAERGSWEQSLAGADALVLGQAQIGGLAEAEFTRNNILATQRILDAIT